MSESIPSYVGLEEQLLLAFDYDLTNQVEEHSVEWLDELVMSATATHQQQTCIMQSENSTAAITEETDAAAAPWFFFDGSQAAILECEFDKCQNPRDDTLRELASQLDVTVDLVNIWFDARRAEERAQLSIVLQEFDQSTFDYFFSAAVETTTIQPAKRDRPAARKRLSKSQVAILEDAFERCQKPPCDAFKLLASRLELPVSRLMSWFKTRRSKQRKLENLGQIERKPVARDFDAAGLAKIIDSMT